jgi:hypothetical protein
MSVMRSIVHRMQFYSRRQLLPNAAIAARRAGRLRRDLFIKTPGLISVTRFFHSFLALCDLAQENLWPPGRWREALQAWSEEGRVPRSWRYAAPRV